MKSEEDRLPKCFVVDTTNKVRINDQYVSGIQGIFARCQTKRFNLRSSMSIHREKPTTNRLSLSDVWSCFCGDKECQKDALKRVFIFGRDCTVVGFYHDEPSTCFFDCMCGGSLSICSTSSISVCVHIAMAMS